MLLTAGERISMALVCMAVENLGVPAVSFTGSQAGIVTDTEHGRAKIIEVRGDRIREALGAGKVAIVAGFQGVSTSREITTMGRGASDLTAVALAAVSAPTCARSTPTSKVCTPPIRVSCPKRTSSARLVRRDARDGRDRRPGARAAVGRVRAQPPRARARSFEFHLGTGNLGHRGGGPVDDIDGAGDHLRRHARRVGGQGHDRAGARPARRRRPRGSARWPTRA